MALDDKTLNNTIVDILSNPIASEDSTQQINNFASLLTQAISTYIQPLVDAHNNHVHAGVIVAVVGESTGTPGNTAATTDTV